MIVVKILSVLLGIAFLLFGYFIYFRKKYNLINGFAEDFQNGKKDEKYPLRVGLTEFIIGCVLLLISAILFIFL